MRPESKMARELVEGVTKICLVTDVSKSVLSDWICSSASFTSAAASQ